jgi:adenylyl- and sulfurtransferase ThiI
VRLKNADSTIYVEVVPGWIYLSLDERVEACGGCRLDRRPRAPLLSGGIDSPVAGLRMMRRGCRVDAVHFHSMPYLDGTSRDKARRLPRSWRAAKGRPAYRWSRSATFKARSCAACRAACASCCTAA